VRRLAAIHLLLGGYVAGLCLALAWRPPSATVIAGGLVCTGLVLGGVLARRRPSPVTLVAGALGVALLLVLVGVSIGAARVAGLRASDLRPFRGQKATIQAVVLDLAKQSGTRVSVPVRVVAVNGRALADKALLQIECRPGKGRGSAAQLSAAELLDPTGRFAEGARVVLAGARIAPLPKPSAGDGFDYGRYLERRGIHVVVCATLANVRVVGRRGGLAAVADRLRLSARHALASGLRSPVREVLRGMVLGDAEGVDNQAIDDFRRSGLLHIMAVSGENVVLLCTLCGAVLSALKLARRLRLALMLPIIFFYVLVTGASASVVRAGVAGGLVTLAGLASRPTDLPLLVLTPAAVLLTLNPWNLLNAGFQLSFAAVIGLFLLARHTTSLLRVLPRPLAETAGITAAASIATAPISLASFGQASLIGIVANVAGGFVLGPVMVCGMLSVVVGLLWPPASLPLNVVAGALIAFLLSVARWCARLPGAVYQWNGASFGFLLVVGSLVLVLVLQQLAGRLGLGVLSYTLVPRRRQAVALAAATLIALSLVWAPPAARAPAAPTVTILSVGEGAAALVQTPGGPTTLIDAGPSPLARTLRHHGVRAIDLLVLSHGHADHTAGLADVLKTFPVRTALLPKPPTPSGALDKLQAELRRHGARVLRCSTPLLASCKGYVVQVLPTMGGQSGEDENQAENDWALVADVMLGGQSILLPGDAEGVALKRAVDGPVTVLELPHHGSAGGLDAAQLAQMAPRLAVISVGPNRYGHPAAEMLALLAAAHTPCLRTDQNGEVSITARSDGLSVAVAQQ
jgi:competence protein ComEC